MSAVAPFSAQRAVAIVEGSTLRASGYLLAPRLVVTCQHFLESIGTWRGVRWDGTPVVFDPQRTLSWPEADFALLFTADTHDVEAVTMGVIDPLYPDRLSFQMFGWPLWGAEVDSQGVLREGGRMIRGHLEPADVSPDKNLVLQPDRSGASHLLGRSDWTGMSGAGVFTLDRLVGVQRRQADVRRPDSIEARPVALILEDPEFRAAAHTAGIVVDDDFTLAGSRARGKRFELHGPDRVPLFSVADFYVRSDGWDRLTWRVTGVQATLPKETLLAGPVETLTLAVNDEGDLGSTGSLLVEVSQAMTDQSSITVHKFEVIPPGGLQVAALFEMTMWLLDLARAGGPPSENLRAALASDKAMALLDSAVALADTGQLVETASQVLGSVRTSISWARTEAQRRLTDSKDHLSPSEREDAKYAHYPAYVVRQKLSEQALGDFDGADPFWSRALGVLGYPSHEAVLRYLRPPLVAQVVDRQSFEVSVLELLLQEGSLDVASADYTAAVGEIQGRFYDLVNALLREGAVRWRDPGVRHVVPTEAGRIRIQRLVDDLL